MATTRSTPPSPSSCGCISRIRRKPPSNPAVVYKAYRAGDLQNVIVPHFDRHPLLAKKAHDFAIWKQGVAVAHAVACRPVRCKGDGGGSHPRWSPEEKAEFVRLSDLLNQQRRYGYAR